MESIKQVAAAIRDDMPDAGALDRGIEEPLIDLFAPTVDPESV